MTRSLSYHLRCRSEGEGNREGERGRTGGTGSTGSGSDETEHTLNTQKPNCSFACVWILHVRLCCACISSNSLIIPRKLIIQSNRFKTPGLDTFSRKETFVQNSVTSGVFFLTFWLNVQIWRSQFNTCIMNVLANHVCEKYARPQKTQLCAHAHLWNIALCLFAVKKLFYHTAEKLIEISGLQRWCAQKTSHSSPILPFLSISCSARFLALPFSLLKSTSCLFLFCNYEPGILFLCAQSNMFLTICWT